MTVLLIPVKSFSSGKSRLAQALDAQQRRELCVSMLEQVLRAADEAQLSRVVILTGSDEVSAWARQRGLLVERDGAEAGLGAVVESGVQHIRSAYGDNQLIVMADLPLVRGDDMKILASAAKRGRAAIAPDRRREGTNALLLPAGAQLPTCFGRPDSFLAHLASLEQAGLSADTVVSRGLGFDIDTEDDLRDYLLESDRPAAINLR